MVHASVVIYAAVAMLAGSAAAANWVGLPVPSRGVIEYAPYDTRAATVYIQSYSTNSSTHPAEDTNCTAHYGLTKSWSTVIDAPMTYAYQSGNNDVWSLTVVAPAGVSWLEFSFYCTFAGTQVWWDGSGSNSYVQVSSADNLTCNTYSKGATSSVTCSDSPSCYSDYVNCATNPSLCDSDEVSAGLSKWVYGCQSNCSSKIGSNGTCCQADYCNSAKQETCFVGSSSTSAKCTAGESCAVYNSGSVVYGCASEALCLNISAQSLGKCCDADLCNTLSATTSSYIEDENETSSASPAVASSTTPASASATHATSSHAVTSSIVTPTESSSHINAGVSIAPVAVVALISALAASF